MSYVTFIVRVSNFIFWPLCSLIHLSTVARCHIRH